jgi:CheY-like chemotaxis protein
MNKPRVLLVDHDRSVLDALGAVIAIEGFQVVRAADGHEALERVRQQPINIAPVDFEHSADLKCDELPEELHINMKTVKAYRLL